MRKSIDELENDVHRAGKHLRGFFLGLVYDDYHGQNLYTCSFRFGGDCYEWSHVVDVRPSRRDLNDATKRHMLEGLLVDLRTRFGGA